MRRLIIIPLGTVFLLALLVKPSPAPLLSGACCFPNGTCVPLTEADCAAGGVYQGDSVPCDPNPCPQPPTETPTATPTNTPTATPTNTRVPLGGDCADTSDCVPNSTCVDGVCTGNPAAVPVASNTGLLIALVVLAAIGGFAIFLRRRSLKD